tara:strand:+ start:229 stop:342 length:114 start_codon:yes stop_codon:yes gene_type:complete
MNNEQICSMTAVWGGYPTLVGTPHKTVPYGKIKRIKK